MKQKMEAISRCIHCDHFVHTRNITPILHMGPAQELHMGPSQAEEDLEGDSCSEMHMVLSRSERRMNRNHISCCDLISHCVQECLLCPARSCMACISSCIASYTQMCRLIRESINNCFADAKNFYNENKFCIICVSIILCPLLVPVLLFLCCCCAVCMCCTLIDTCTCTSN